MSASAPAIAAIRDVTALVGNDFTPQRVDLTLRDGQIAAIAPAGQGADGRRRVRPRTARRSTAVACWPCPASSTYTTIFVS